MKSDIGYSMDPKIKEALSHLRIQVDTESPMFGSDMQHIKVSLFLGDVKLSSDYVSI